MRCPDCKGSGEYEGATVIEECKLCEGTGQVEMPDHRPTDEQLFTTPPNTFLEPAQPEVGHKVFIAKDFNIECEITEVNADKSEFGFVSNTGRGYARFDEVGWNHDDGRWVIA